MNKLTALYIRLSTEDYKVESMSTYVRRSSTISGWINWMLGLVGV